MQTFDLMLELRFRLKIVDSDLCTKCVCSVRGGYLQIFCYSSTIKPLGEYINTIVGTVIDKALPRYPDLHLIGYKLLSFEEKLIRLAASTAAKKTITKNWFEPIMVMKRSWLTVFLLCLST